MAYEVLNRKKGSEKQHPNSISLVMNIFITVDLIVEKMLRSQISVLIYRGVVIFARINKLPVNWKIYIFLFTKLSFLLIPLGWSYGRGLDQPCYASMDLEVYQKRTCCARKQICTLKNVTASCIQRSVDTMYAVVEEK